MEKAIQLPRKINFYNFAKKEVKLNGNYKISDLSRLSEISSNENDKVDVELTFQIENGKTPCVEGIIKLKLILDCQRCLDNLELDLRVTFRIAFTRNESQTDSLDDKFEIYLIGEEELDTKNLITDEILLSIPMAPSHDFDCDLKTDKGDIVEEIRERPFDALKNIKIANFGKE